MLKILPIGEQDFAGLVEFNAIYTDKTESIYNLFDFSNLISALRNKKGERVVVLIDENDKLASLEKIR